MNVISISGNISQAAEVRHTASGDQVATFSVADNQGKDKPAIFWRCQLWGKQAESLSQYLGKGQAVTVVGNVTQSQFKDKTTGQDRTSFDIRVQDLALQGGKREESEKPRQDQNNQRQAPKNDTFEDDDINF